MTDANEAIYPRSYSRSLVEIELKSNHLQLTTENDWKEREKVQLYLSATVPIV